MNEHCIRYCRYSAISQSSNAHPGSSVTPAAPSSSSQLRTAWVFTSPISARAACNYGTVADTSTTTAATAQAAAPPGPSRHPEPTSSFRRPNARLCPLLTSTPGLQYVRHRCYCCCCRSCPSAAAACCCCHHRHHYSCCAACAAAEGPGAPGVILGMSWKCMLTHSWKSCCTRSGRWQLLSSSSRRKDAMAPA